MIANVYMTITASPLWWVILLGSFLWQLLATRNKPFSWKLRLFQVGLSVATGITVLNLVHRIDARADKYVVALMFMGAAIALPLAAKRLLTNLKDRKPNATPFILSTLLSALVIVPVSGSLLIFALSILLFVP